MLNRCITNIKSVFFYIIWHHTVFSPPNAVLVNIVFIWLGFIWLILPVFNRLGQKLCQHTTKL